VTSIRSAWIGRVLLIGVILWGLHLPLHDLLAYPDRISVLSNLRADADTYDRAARRFATTWSSDDLPVRIPPGWITVLALLYAVTGPSFVAGKLLNFAALIVVLLLSAWIARRAFGPGSGWAAAVLVAMSPAFRGYVGVLQYEVFTAALLCGTLALAIRTAEAATPRALWRRALITAPFAAALVITREPFAPAVIALGVWVALRTRATAGPRMALAAGATMIALAAVPSLAWSAMQIARTGELVTSFNQGPIVAELGHNPLANGTFNAPLLGIGQPTGVRFALAYPGREVQLAARKVLYFWGVLRDGWNVPRPAAVWVWRATTGRVPLAWIEPWARGGALLLTVLIALALWTRTEWRCWWVFPAVLAAVMLMYIITLSSFRFSVPSLPVVYILASGPVASLARRTTSALAAPVVMLPVALVLTIAIAMQFQSWPLTISLDAAGLEGVGAANTIDAVSQRPARVADARRGVRPVALLPDEYLPAGRMVVTIRARSVTPAVSPQTAVARLVVFQFDGRPACASDLTEAQLPAAFGEVAVPCGLTTDGPATLIVYSLGANEIAIDRVNLKWMP
jgi:hypothetical protein